ncbi:MAG: hypothetical protein EXQ92_07535 [Alphaproteobacteria bacterium]|nr:hypothetical protein [Alphaproteobacteria bacterium]
MTPSNRLDGTAVSASQRNLARQETVESAVAARWDTNVRAWRAGDNSVIAAPANRRTPNTAKPIDQIARWSVIRKDGSGRKGNASKASKLPALLAAYKKYGSRACR